MRLLLLTALAMTAFAANSLLNRAAVGAGLIDPFSFAAIRVASGAAVLLVLVRLRGKPLPWRGRLVPVLSLTAYMMGFSAAYLGLAAGTGALILFGTVQVTMFIGARRAGESLPARRWIGAGLALVGLAALLLPGAGAVPELPPALAMVAAGIGWGIYSLSGRGGTDPLAATAANFTLALPLVLLPLLFSAPQLLSGPQVDPAGIELAIASGAIASGLGYALWFAVVPQLGAARAAVAQLSVPVIALAGGALLLAEMPQPAVILAALLVLAGVALAARR